MKLIGNSSLGDQLRNNLATLAISAICLAGVLVVAFRPPTEQIRHLSRQLTEERAKLAAKSQEDDDLIASNQNQLLNTQQELIRVEKALSENEVALRNTQAALAEITTPRRSAAEIHMDQIVDAAKKTEKLKKDLNGVHDAYLSALEKAQSDMEAYSREAQGLAQERKTLADITLALRVLKGEIPRDRAKGMRKQWSDYLPTDVILDSGKTAKFQQDSQSASEFQAAMASNDPIGVRRELQNESEKLESAVETIRELENKIRDCEDETIDLQRAITTQQGLLKISSSSK